MSEHAGGGVTTGTGGGTAKPGDKGSVDRYRGVCLPVLDHGHVMLVDYMGSDTRIEEVARLSYNVGGLALSHGEGDKGDKGGDKNRSVRDTRGLLRYLLRHAHTSPFEQVCVTLDMKLPIFVARQLVRHRTQKLNEVSARYSVLPEEFYLPALEQVCVQSETNKQGRGGVLPLEVGVMVRESMKQHSENGFRLYHELLEKGVARETARMVLSVNTYTHWCTTWDAHNLLHMLRLRLDPHAQWEVREYARVISEVVCAWLPLTWEAFTDYTLRSVKLSRHEWEVLVQSVNREHVARLLSLPERDGASPERLSLREKREFLALLGRGDNVGPSRG
jgi:thymidylate synthase (FAD)